MPPFGKATRNDDNEVLEALEADGTAGRVQRQVYLQINDGTAPNTVLCLVGNR